MLHSILILIYTRVVLTFHFGYGPSTHKSSLGETPAYSIYLPPCLDNGHHRLDKMGNSVANLQKMPTDVPRKWELKLEKAGRALVLPPGEVIRLPSVEFPDFLSVVRHVSRKCGGKSIGAILITGKLNTGGEGAIRITETGPGGMLIKGEGMVKTVLQKGSIFVASEQASGRVCIEDLSIVNMLSPGLTVTKGVKNVRIARCRFAKGKEAGIAVNGAGTELEIHNCDIAENSKCGLKVTGGSNCELSGKDTHIHQNGGPGILVRGENTLLSIYDHLDNVNNFNDNFGPSKQEANGGRIKVILSHKVWISSSRTSVHSERKREAEGSANNKNIALASALLLAKAADAKHHVAEHHLESSVSSKSSSSTSTPAAQASATTSTPATTSPSTPAAQAPATTSTPTTSSPSTLAAQSPVKTSTPAITTSSSSSGSSTSFASSTTPSTASASDWNPIQLKDGRVYYHNHKTNQTSWEAPVDLHATTQVFWHSITTSDGRVYYVSSDNETSWQKPNEGLLPRGWTSKKSPEGRIYFYDSATGKTQWHAPPK